MKNLTQTAAQNHILNSLGGDELERMLPDMELVTISKGEVLYNPDEKITHVYFPVKGMISVTSLTAEGQQVEIGTIGREGMAGLNVCMEADRTPHESMAQIAGAALKMKASALKDEFNKGGTVQKSLLRFMHAYLLLVSQTAVCNRLHPVDRRLARWLLMCRDRVQSNLLSVTQEFLAAMLGSNRPTVTGAALALKNEGFIKYTRGKVEILEANGLENYTCECYQIVKAEYDRLPKYIVNQICV